MIGKQIMSKRCTTLCTTWQKMHFHLWRELSTARHLRKCTPMKEQRWWLTLMVWTVTSNRQTSNLIVHKPVRRRKGSYSWHILRHYNYGIDYYILKILRKHHVYVYIYIYIYSATRFKAWATMGT